MTDTTDNLKRFLSGYKESRSREYVLTTRLVHDLTVAAAGSGYNLLVYLPTVDADGFDVIFDDRDRLVAIQLKSVVGGGRAANWSVRRSLLRPKPEEVELFGFEPSQSGTGRGGGVILTTAKATGQSIEVRYSYTDMMVLSAIWAGIIKRPKRQQNRLHRLREDLQSESTGSVELPRSALVRAATPVKLLAVMGLHCQIQTNWRLSMSQLLRSGNLGARLPAPSTHLTASVASELGNLAEGD